MTKQDKEKDIRIGRKVLNFYKTLPFNYYSGIDEQLKSITTQNKIEQTYPPLKGLLGNSKNILELGSGAGWLTNSIAFQHKRKILGLDFNQLAIDRAKSIAKELGLQSKFLCEDIFVFLLKKL